MASIAVNSRSKTIKGYSSSLDTLLIAPIVKKISKENRLDPNRIRLTYKDANGKHLPLDTSKSLMDYFGGSELTKVVDIYAKDLGPQIAWKTVFFLEYLGPLVLHLLFYAYFAGFKQVSQSQTQVFAFIMVTLHFAKREVETIAIHKFSNATMPLFNLFKNSSHYWFLSGFNLAFFVYGRNSASLASASSLEKFIFHVNNLPSSTNYLIFGLWAFAELSNLKTHIALSNLRKNDDKAYVIPHGYGFDLVACPNYFFEALSWIFYSILVGNWSAWVFMIVGTGQMYIWAVQKHKRYLKTFGDDYKKLRRTAMFPFIA
ncbi:hypothetical protein FT663_01770 [Candidozyma haemuli var. vulneris]|uniref:3-oxo-5-alpha-steroid 4-dehydrogenase C-terminal domain-containing protein n=1 Tax=Candidozyma haemuli TaxID=45357 RepID=A0A2V1ASP0_9ASCO|nr:hypothetical protein CXQ85_002320 [[Candida] haemuloni]KAF3989526.1 hypothetical protein FT662_02795 [[Candida] haemuloni var. vulneris]KAF3993781.1 hypothetical protein FT663_01770 [[Candida] haemuloni var. vulneris]PVH20526.1 hypothetical protein CXQ85_002320 [[Candida] haemuloni]